MSERYLITLDVNGAEHELLVEARHTLADVLRHDLELTGTHVGCEHGVCGACTVLLDGAPARACLVFAVQAEGRAIRTVESLGAPGELNDLQEAFVEHHGLQCGFCTPGFLMMCKSLLDENPHPTHGEIVHHLEGNICRCTGYRPIVEAMMSLAVSPDTPEEAGPHA
jgi:aerobic-type carbon monoxide dehydrogenase small subunit (CoxS/CutS family)